MTDPIIQFALGTTLGGIAYLPALGITASPLFTYQPYAVADELGDLSLEGNGFPIVTWHYDILPIGEADIFRGYLSGNLSARMYVRSALNALSSGSYTWQTWVGWMKWMRGSEDLRNKRVLNVDITFNGLVVAS